MTWLEGPQKVDEFDENDKFAESDDSEEISPRLLTKLYEWIDMTWLEGPQNVDEFGEGDDSDEISPKSCGQNYTSE